MKKLLTVLAAAAAAVAAAITIPAAANGGAGGKAAKPAPSEPSAPTELVSCLRAHGLNPPADVLDLKPWIVRQARTSAGKAGLNACGVGFGSPQGGTDNGKDLASCLRSHGADVPSGADGLALKTWIGDHRSDAQVTDALNRCSGGATSTAKPAG